MVGAAGSSNIGEKSLVGVVLVLLDCSIRMYAKASHFKTDCERDLALKARAKLRYVQVVADVDDTCGHVVVCPRGSPQIVGVQGAC